MLSLAFSFLALLGSAAAQEKLPVHVDHSIFAFGSVVSGQAVSHAFVIQNQSDAPLTIQGVTSPCPCFHASFDKRIEAGRAGRVLVNLDTSKLEGPVLLTVAVSGSDAAAGPLTALEIKGFVKGAIMLLPRDHVNVTTVTGRDKEQSLELEVNRPRPLTVFRIESTSGVFVPRLETLIAGRHYRILVKFNGSQAVGIYDGTIRIHTDDVARPVIPIKCSLLVVSTVVVEPDKLFLPSVSQQEARKGKSHKDWKVVVRDVNGRAFNIVAITASVPFVHVWYQARPDGKSYDVLVELKPTDQLLPGQTVSYLHVKTNLPEAQDIQIPVWIEVQ